MISVSPGVEIKKSRVVRAIGRKGMLRLFKIGYGRLRMTGRIPMTKAELVFDKCVI
jgi:hypothetical protein